MNALKPQPTSTKATAGTAAYSASASHLITLRRMIISGNDKAAMLIMKASVVPMATPLPSMASATGITPVALERHAQQHGAGYGQPVVFAAQIFGHPRFRHITVEQRAEGDAGDHPLPQTTDNFFHLVPGVAMAAGH